MTSINFNASATTALRTLQTTNSALETTQNRVATGLKIGEAKDNAAYWAISTTLKSDNKSLATVKDALNLGAATVDTAYQGLNKAKDVLDEIKSKLTAATQDGVDRAVIQSEISALQDQLKSIASSSTFSGENWLSVNSAATGFNADKEIVASFSRDSSNAVTIGTVQVDIDTVKLYDSNGNSGILDKAQQLTAGTTALTYGGSVSGTAPTAAALTAVTGGSAGTDAIGAIAGSVTLGTFSMSGIQSGDQVSFNLAIGGNAAQVVTLNTNEVSDSTTFLSALNDAIDAAVGAGVVTASLNTDGKVVLTSDVAGANSGLVVTGTAASDGDGLLSTGALGLTNAASPVFGTSTAAVATATNVFAPVTAADAGDGFSFKLQVGNKVFQTAVDASAYADIDAAIVGLQASINAATDVDDGTTPLGAGQVIVGKDAAGTRLTFTTVGLGLNQAVGVFDAALTNDDATVTEVLPTFLTAVTANGNATTASTAAGTFDTTNVQAGDTIGFSLNVSGDTANIAISTNGFSATTSAADRALFVSRTQAAIDASAIGAGKVTVAVDSGTNAITFTTVDKGAAEYVTLNNTTVADTSAPTSTTLGLDTTGAVTVAGAAAVAATSATAVGTINTFATQTLDSDDTIKFTIALGGGAATTVTIDKDTIDTALGTTDGVIGNAAQLALVTQQALTEASITSVNVTEAAGTLTFTAATPGANSIVIGDAVGSAGGNKISVADIDLTATAFTSLTSEQKKDVLTAYLSVVNQALSSVTTAASNLGAVSSRIDLQNSFVDTLIDTIDKGVSNLVDADLSEESTKLQALQTKQSLGIQALSIANSSQQNILRLFQ